MGDHYDDDDDAPAPFGYDLQLVYMKLLVYLWMKNCEDNETNEMSYVGYAGLSLP